MLVIIKFLEGLVRSSLSMLGWLEQAAVEAAAAEASPMMMMSLRARTRAHAGASREV